jgi:hypothetical protein
MFGIIHPARETSDVLQICRISSMLTSQSKATQKRQLLSSSSATTVFCQRSMRDSEVAAKRKDTRQRGSGPVFLWSVKGRLETGTMFPLNALVSLVSLRLCILTTGSLPRPAGSFVRKGLFFGPRAPLSVADGNERG